LSDAFLAYADALARGAVPLEKRRHDDEALEPDPVDVVAALQTAILAPEPARRLKRWRPIPQRTRGYAKFMRPLGLNLKPAS
jgi:hypothetical protein